MTRGRLWTIYGVLAVTVVTFLVTVLWWGAARLEQVSWVAGILGLVATVLIAVIGQGATGQAEPRQKQRRWDRAPVRSGVGPALGLGALGLVLIAATVLGGLAILSR
jgi:chromate transport protein ChrA